jgi:hypothetical protein
MTPDFLPLFRRHLFAWFEARLASGRTPFRRVEEQPPLLTGGGAPADLVLWVNRDSLLAGAVILLPGKRDADFLRQGAVTARALGLTQFITWEAREVNLWQVAEGGATLRKHWALPHSRQLSATDFTVVGDNLLQELKLSAITGSCPAAALPAEYFVNLCLLNLRAMQPTFDEAARLEAGGTQSDALTTERARNKGWLTLWRLLALLYQQRLPLGVAPERMEQALGYAVADLPTAQAFWLAPAIGEISLPGPAATRCQQLAGRLAQLEWPNKRERVQTTLALLLNEAARDCQAEVIDEALDATGLTINRLPTEKSSGGSLVAPRPCLAGWVLLATLDGALLPATLAENLAQLPQGAAPHQVNAWLSDTLPPTPLQRRQHVMTLRRAWPHRRFSPPAATPAWVWDALFLAGISAPEGELQLTLPADWAETPGVALLWQLLGEQRALIRVKIESDGRQTLNWGSLEQPPAQLVILTASGERLPMQLPTTEIPLTLLAGLGEPMAAAKSTRMLRRPPPNTLEKQIAATVFRDGLPRFPEDYLRRRDAVSLCHFQLPGPLLQESSFFGCCRLRGPQGELFEVDSQITAEALILAAHDGRRQVSLPADPLLTAELVKAYRQDLQNLWDNLTRECRRHLPRQREARALARRLWKHLQRPAVEQNP